VTKSKSTSAATHLLVKRLTGADLAAARNFLLSKGFARGEGFWSQYAGQATVSCTTTAICVYALSQTGRLTNDQVREFREVLSAFRYSDPIERAGAFPRTTGSAPNTWTTGQAVLALLGLGTPWKAVQPSVDWLLRTQSPNGGWNYPGSIEGRERLIYTLYPTLVLLRCRRHIRARAISALARVAQFVDSCEERNEPFWAPLRHQLRTLVSRRATKDVTLDPYVELFEERWPTIRVDENWLPDRFSMALTCGANYLHLRHVIRPDHPTALLHIRYLADERVGSGWSDEREQEPKTWATALGALTLHRWANDLIRSRANPNRIPIRPELLARFASETGRAPALSRHARSLLRRLSTISPGNSDAVKYQVWVRDAFAFLFGDVLKEPKVESKTFFDTLRRDITFRNAAESGPWFDWKMLYEIDPVPIECKNKDRLTYGDFRQTASYLGKRMGYLGILACRKTTGSDEERILNWFVGNDEKYVLVVNDEMLSDWIRLKDRGGDATTAIADLYRSLREGAQ